MPGISFIYDFRGGVREKQSRILRSLDSLLHTKDYEKTILLDENFYFLGCTRYQEYPLVCFESSSFQIYLEGEIYGKDHALVNRELNTLAAHIFQPQFGVEEDIKDWLLNTDGDFVVFILSKESGDIVILNDALGRLPLYYSEANGQLIVSREVRFITGLKKDSKFDRMAISQYLLFGFPLGERTLLANIHRLRPACFMRINIPLSKVTVNRVDCLNFESKQHPIKQIDENARELVSLFSQACLTRTHAVNKNVLALSGGLDSRSVGACLFKNNIPFSALTLDIDKIFASDVEIAQQLAQIFNVHWKTVYLDPPKGKDFLKLLRIKSGLNYLGMSFILPFFDKIKETFGPQVTYWTGDGGNKLQMDYRPERKLEKLADLINYIITRHQVLPLATVAALTQIGEQEILEDIESVISLYPERDLAAKYLRFYIDEKTFKWNFEGEDRNRFYFWSVAPFFSIHFFKYLMGCPEEQKAGHTLYGAFLAKLSPQASTIDNANWGFTLGSKKYQMMALLRKLLLDKLTPAFKKRIKRIRNVGPYKSSSQYQAVIELQLRSCNSIKTYLAPQALEHCIKNCGKTDLATLLTITSAIEEFECSKSIFKEYYEVSLS